MDLIRDQCKRLKFPLAKTSQPLKEDPKYFDGEAWLDEQDITLWIRSEDPFKVYHDGHPVEEWNDYSKSNIHFKFKEDAKKTRLYTRPNLATVPSANSKVPAVQFNATSLMRSQPLDSRLLHNDFTVFFVKRNSRPTVPNQFFFQIQDYQQATTGAMHLYEGKICSNIHYLTFV
jgi:hypothetical protein